MKAIELFAGAGGLGLGLTAAGFKPGLIVEWDRWCCDTIRENRSHKHSPIASWPEPTHSDVREVEFENHRGVVDLISGGPPCQPFSLGGKHAANLDQRDMWPQAVRAVREVKPRAFLFENVKGLTRSSFASYLAYIVHQLTYPELIRNEGDSWEDHLRKLEQHHTSGTHAGLKYNVVWQVLNAADYGVPQKRERVVFVGFRNDVHVPWSFPRPTHSFDALIWDQFVSMQYWERHSTRPTLEADKHLGRIRSLRDEPILSPWRTVRDAIGDLPEPYTQGSRIVADHRYQPGARSYPGHTGSHIDLPAKTLKAGVHGVPGGENMLLKADGSVRYFTIRESARLQTFPDSYRFHGSWTETMRQLGNAVPVDLAAVVARSVLDHLTAVSNMTGDSSQNGFH